MAKEQPNQSHLDQLVDTLISPRTYDMRRSRRGIFGDAARFSVQLATAVSLTENIGTIASPYYDLLLGSPEFERKHTYTKTFYEEHSLQKTHSFVIGDSIAKGIIDGQPTFAGTEWVKNLVNSNFHSNWQYHNLAVQGSRITAVEQQLIAAKTIISSIPKGESIDFIISVGGNDVGQAVVREAKKGDTKLLLRGDITLGIIPLAHETLGEINDYEQNLTLLMGNILQLRKQGHNIQRIFLEGLPDLGNTDNLALLDEKGKEVVVLDLTNNNNLRKLARNMSSLINQSMSNAIDTTNADINILLIDNFHSIPKGQLKGLHPTKQGQYTIGREHLHRSFASFKGKVTSFGQQIQELVSLVT